MKKILFALAALLAIGSGLQAISKAEVKKLITSGKVTKEEALGIAKQSKATADELAVQAAAHAQDALNASAAVLEVAQ